MTAVVVSIAAVTMPTDLETALADVACPRGDGDGVYEPLAAPAAVVAVVGTAHVRGIIREWRRASDGAELDVDRLLSV